MTPDQHRQPSRKLSHLVYRFKMTKPLIQFSFDRNLALERAENARFQNY